MKAAVLGNGKSRFLYTNPNEYDYVIGCNIPWTNVNDTVIIDEKVVEYLYNNKEKYKYCHKTIFSRKSWTKIIELHAEYYFSPHITKIIEIEEGIDSSAHIALKYILSLDRFSTIHLYGCDSRWSNDTSSRTHQYVNNKPPDQSTILSLWNSKWDSIIDQNMGIDIMFIGELCSIR
jgi:hypothetical protein